ncbi:hypothetical protein GH714_002917 [Hevea brasiliensis]|uniref:Transposase-associated domain-containing protein n=1 Tax=Hevea brasiliensis TaxID=3981 RepID=A0A6A6MYM7_HEVBR|nr:hypothetical protein GH714_002917 [Hevea brasiliensis]
MGLQFDVRCSCVDCLNVSIYSQVVVLDHLLLKGINKFYTRWIHYKEAPEHETSGGMLHDAIVDMEDHELAPFDRVDVELNIVNVEQVDETLDQQGRDFVVDELHERDETLDEYCIDEDDLYCNDDGEDD